MKERVPAMVSVLLLLFASSIAWSADAPRMSKEGLRPLLGLENVVVIDTRLPGDWGASQGKILGAHRRSADEVASWAPDFPKDATIVVYCA